MGCGAKAVFLEALDHAESLQLIIWAAQGYRGQLEDSVPIVCGCKLEIVKRNEPGFKILPPRWVVKLTFAWLGNNINLSKDYEELREVSEPMVYAAFTFSALAYAEIG